MWRVKMSLAHAMKDVATLNKTIEQHCTRVRCACTIFTNRGENVQNAASLYMSQTRYDRNDTILKDKDRKG